VLLDELCEGALEALEHEVKVEDLVHAYRLSRCDRFRHGLGLDALNLFDGAARDSKHDDERHLALRASDLKMKALLLVTEDLYIAALEAAPANRTVVKPSPVADELDDAHRETHITPRESALAPAFDAGAATRAHRGRVNSAGWQHHSIARRQLDFAALSFEDERDRALNAIEDLLVTVAMRRVSISRPVRPRVTTGCLGAQLGHELVGGRHPHDSKIALVKPRFLADCNVGRLARWLRALGYDASYHARIGDAELVREAAAESRVLLTRDRDLTKRRVIQTGVVRAILIRDDEVTKQLRQVFAELGLELKEALTRCIECNSELESRVPATVAERVPPYVRLTQSRYSECPDCGRIYWAGTHWQRMREVLAGL
jgi:uncharacterized protein